MYRYSGTLTPLPLLQKANIRILAELQVRMLNYLDFWSTRWTIINFLEQFYHQKMQVSSPVIKVDKGKIPKVMQMFMTDKLSTLVLKENIYYYACIVVLYSNIFNCFCCRSHVCRNQRISLSDSFNTFGHQQINLPEIHFYFKFIRDL